MAFIGSYNPLSCDNYINAGNYFQKQLSNDSNLAVRTALVFAKIVGRGQDVLIHAGLGSIKLITSIVMAAHSIPAAAFDSVPTHHKVAKEAFRHFSFTLFFMADIPLSLTHICKMYPESLCRKIQQRLRISPNNLAFETLLDNAHTEVGILSEIEESMSRKTFQENEQLKQENEQLQKKYNELNQKYIDLLQDQLECINSQIKKKHI